MNYKRSLNIKNINPMKKLLFFSILVWSMPLMMMAQTSCDTIDMAIQVLHPDGDICADPHGFVKLKIKNHGREPMSFSTSPLQIKVQFGGVSTQSVSHTISEGSLDAYQDMVVEIPDINYSLAGNYNVKAYLVRVNGDSCQINDTSTKVSIVANSNIAAVPYVIDFEPHQGSAELHFDTTTTFPASWARDYTASNFQWKINMGTHPDGPAFDNTTGFSDGQYAIVTSTGNVPSTAVATLTSTCVDFHHNELGYPKILSYYEHILGTSATNVKMSVQIGSGTYYQTVDSIMGRTHNNENEPWLNRKIALLNINENARIRFVVSEQDGNVNPAIDDIKVYLGLPELALERILTPVDTVCLRKGQTLWPRVRVCNNGLFPVYGFTVFFQLRIGAIIQPDTIHWSGTLMPDQCVPIQTSSGIVVPELGNVLEFVATVFIENDSYEYNNTNSVLVCTTVDIEEPHYTNNGIVLEQNIPNPAGDKTIIPYILPENGKATISIYSIEGQQLHSAKLNSITGNNSYEFDVAHLANGIYIYTLQFKGTTLYKKMIVRK